MRAQHLSIFVVGLVVLGILVVSASAAPTLPGRAAPSDTQAASTILVSVSNTGSQGNRDSQDASISGDGRYVAFVSRASNLVSDDTNECSDVFVRDTQAGTIQRVSIASDGTQADSASLYPSISANGRYVAFSSGATNLVDGGVPFGCNIFVHDRDADEDGVFDEPGAVRTILVSVPAFPASLGYLNCSGPSSISAGGRYVAFSSRASNLIGSDTNGDGICDTDCDDNNRDDIFVRDLILNQTTLVSRHTNGALGNDDSTDPDISADGRYVAFWSDASNLVNDDTNGRVDAFVRDRQANVTVRASVTDDGAQAPNGCSFRGMPSISADGRYVAFAARDPLVSGDTNGTADIYVRDLVANRTLRASLGIGGVQPQNDCLEPSISADGRYVAFGCSDRNLVPQVDGVFEDIFVRDLLMGQTICAAVSSSGQRANSFSQMPAVSADGRYVAFESYASNLVSGDINFSVDIFLHGPYGLG